MTRRRSSRVLATVVFTDVAGSSELASELGDRRWRVLLAMHHRLVRRELRRFGGVEVDTAGDGFFATFSDQGLAIRCACAISEAVRELGIEVRCGVHVGQVERAGGSLRGIAVHIGARIMAVADPGEVLVSSVLKDLVPGAGFAFVDRGLRHLKGIPDEVRIYEVTSVDGIGRSSPLAIEEARRRRSAIEPPPLLGRRRGRVELIALVAVALIVAAGVGVLVVAHGSGGSASAGQLRAPANALVRIDPLSNRVDGKPIPLAWGLAQVAVSGRSVWVVSPTARLLERIDPVARHVTKVVSLAGTPTGIATGSSGSVWVALGLANRIARYEVRDGSVVSQESPPLGCCAGPRLVAVNPSGVFVTGPDGLTRIASDLQPSVASAFAGWESGIAAEPQDICLANGWDRVGKVTPGPTGIAAAPTSVPVLGGPAALAFGAGFIWATARYGNQVFKIEPEIPVVVTRTDVGQDPCCVAYGAGAVWVGNSADGTVSRIDPVTGKVIKKITVGARIGGIAVGAGGVWVTTQPAFAKDRVAGTIAFSDAGDLTLENADGTGRRTLTRTGRDYYPSWSPDGGTIVFARGHSFGSHLFTIHPDGSGLRQLTTGFETGYTPAWSPYIAFLRGTNDHNDLWVVSPDGSGFRRVTHDDTAYAFPAWTPDGSSITAFRADLPAYAPAHLLTVNPSNGRTRTLWSMNDPLFGYAWSRSGDLISYGAQYPSLRVDLTGRSGAAPITLLAAPPAGLWAGGIGSTWSPDGTAIAVGGQYEGTGDIYIMNSDGTGVSRLTRDGHSAEPSWRPNL